MLVRKFTRNLEDYGLWLTLRKAINFLLKPVYQKKAFIIYELNIDGPPKRERNMEGYISKLLATGDDSFINQIEEMEEWLKGSLKARIKTNGLCMALIKRNQVIGFNLATMGEGSIPLLKLRVITSNSEAWSEQITIHKDFRRKGLGTELRSKFYSELKNRGVIALYGHRQEWNIASKRSVRKYTSKELVKAEYTKIFNFERLRYTKLSSDYSDDKNRKAKFEKPYYVEPNRQAKYLFNCGINEFKS